MEINLSDSALKWFKEEIGVNSGDKVRFYAKFYGTSPVQEGYSLGFSKDDPINASVSKDYDGIVFFVEESDLWYFDSHNLHVEYDEKHDEIEFKYIKP